MIQGAPDHDGRRTQGGAQGEPAAGDDHADRHARADHGDHRRVHRQRGAQRHGGKPRLVGRRDRVGRHRLHPRHRHRHAAQRLADGTLRAPQLLRRVRGAVHHRVDHVRHRHQRVAARGLPRAPRLGRRRAAADGASDPVRVLSARKARRRDGDLRLGRDGRPRAGPDAGRRDRRQLQLAFDFLHQHPDRDRRVRHDAALHSRSGVSQTRQVAGRRVRPGLADGGRRVGAVRARARAARGLVLVAHHRHPDRPSR